MTIEQIHRIVSEGLFPDTKLGVSLLETHISWVILTNEFAFKIKKPVHFDFLDFSTLELRRHFCEEEYRLRMDDSMEMDKLLMAGAVAFSDLENLAVLLAAFHLQHRLAAEHPYHPEQDAHDFAGLFPLESDLAALPVADAERLRIWANTIPAFLAKQSPRLEARLRSGFWIEGHGDLHSRNIFLPKNTAPIVFDCLEFNPQFRRMDVLNELAFLCMDLEFYNRKDLSNAFLERYKRAWACFEKPEDTLLFTYFKAYRANVRLKVTLLELRQHPNEKLVKNALAYWKLLKEYMEEIP